MSPKDEARERLLLALPHLKTAVKLAATKASPDAKVMLGVMAREPNGSGSVSATFEAAAFLADLALLVDFTGPEPTELDVLAADLLAQLGLKP